MKIRNVSGADRAVVPADEPEFVVDAGSTVEVSDELGAALLDQEDNWRAADTTSVPSGTVVQVLSWVGESKARAESALDAEQERDNPRKSLVEALDEIVNPEKES